MADMSVPLVTNLKLEVYAVLRYLWGRNYNAKRIHKNLSKFYGPMCPTLQTVIRWVREFDEGRTDISRKKKTLLLISNKTHKLKIGNFEQNFDIGMFNLYYNKANNPEDDDARVSMPDQPQEFSLQRAYYDYDKTAALPKPVMIIVSGDPGMFLINFSRKHEISINNRKVGFLDFRKFKTQSKIFFDRTIKIEISESVDAPPVQKDRERSINTPKGRDKKEHVDRERSINTPKGRDKKEHVDREKSINTPKRLDEKDIARKEQAIHDILTQNFESYEAASDDRSSVHDACTQNIKNLRTRSVEPVYSIYDELTQIVEYPDVYSQCDEVPDEPIMDEKSDAGDGASIYDALTQNYDHLNLDETTVQAEWEKPGYLQKVTEPEKKISYDSTQEVLNDLELTQVKSNAKRPVFATPKPVSKMPKTTAPKVIPPAENHYDCTQEVLLDLSSQVEHSNDVAEEHAGPSRGVYYDTTQSLANDMLTQSLEDSDARHGLPSETNSRQSTPVKESFIMSIKTPDNHTIDEFYNENCYERPPRVPSPPAPPEVKNERSVPESFIHKVSVPRKRPKKYDQENIENGFDMNQVQCYSIDVNDKTDRKENDPSQHQFKRPKESNSNGTFNSLEKRRCKVNLGNRVDINVKTFSHQHPNQSKDSNTSGILEKRLRLTNNCKPEYKIMFTNMNTKALGNIALNLGGRIVSDDANILVSEKMGRNFKILWALSKGIPVVSEKWLRESSKCNKFLDPNKYILKGRFEDGYYDFEKIMKYNHDCFKDYKIYFTPNVVNFRIEILVKLNQGECFKIEDSTKRIKYSKDDKVFTVSCPEDREYWTFAPKPVVSVRSVSHIIFDPPLISDLKKFELK